MSTISQISTTIFCAIAAVLLSGNSLRVGIALALLTGSANVWANEICRAMQTPRAERGEGCEE